MTDDERFELQRKAIDALQRIKNQNRIYETKNQLILNEKPSKISYIIETYDKQAFNDKLTYDIGFYNVLLSNMKDNSKEKDEVASSIEELLNIVHEIYQEINVKPQTYGISHFNGLTTMESIEKEARRLIVEYIDKNYYSLPMQERDKKYKDKTLQLANELVSEYHIDIDEAVELSQKKIILEQFLRKVAFPLIPQGRIDELINESQNDEFFDNTRLIHLYEQFNNKLDRITTILASVV